MLRAIALSVEKEFRLLRRDAIGLFMLIVAPIAVIAAAGFSLANIYGTDPTGATAFVVAVVNEDRGAVGRAVIDTLSEQHAVRVRVVGDRAQADWLLRDRRIATMAIIVPAGTTAALTEGGQPRLILYTDPVRYLETVKIELRLSELCRAITARAAAQARERLMAVQDQLRHELQSLATSAREARARIERASHDAGRAQEALRPAFESAIAAAQARTATVIEDVLREAGREAQASVRERQSQLEPLRQYIERLKTTQGEFEQWLTELKKHAGGRAQSIPPPPAFPVPPPEPAIYAAPPFDASAIRDRIAERLKLAAHDIKLPDLPAIPAIAPPPEIKLPDLDARVIVPGSLAFEERDMTGQRAKSGEGFNTFDLHVPGFGVTFLLIGMLMGVSLALIDEREWGTFERLRSLPAPLSATLIGKLVARFAVGLAQMVVLFAIGRLLFGISLGRSPAALLMPAAAIAFAGSAFGLIVAGVARTREAVLPIGAIVIMTMSAVGGCWWPLDFEPRWMQTVALALPTTWSMQAFNDLMIRHLGAASAAIPSLINFGFGLVYMMVGMLIVRRRLG
jgi:ABC-type multidrug transport system permease subunit